MPAAKAGNLGQHARPADSGLQNMESSAVPAGVVEWDNGQALARKDLLAAEEPLEIRVAGRPFTVTMRTPGHDHELTAGLLFSEGLIAGAEQILELRQELPGAAGASNTVHIEIAGWPAAGPAPDRTFAATSACGVCGKASIESIRRRGLRPPNPAFTVDPEVLCQLPERLQAAQQVFGRTGGLHAAGLFDRDGNLMALREDIGRHNAVDKIVGWALLEQKLPLAEHVLLVSGRGGFEIAQKALAAGIPVLASVSAPSSLAVRLASEFYLTLIGFLRGRRFVLYAGQSRCQNLAAGSGAED